jgi:transcriptional regulator with XRE-family HTH domain
MARTKTYSSLKAWRLERGLNQRDAALKLGISQSMYARLEVGRGAKKQSAKAVSDKTGVPFDIVIGVA